MKKTSGAAKASLIKSIEQEKGKMSKGRQAVADLILTDYEQAAYMTAARIGKEAGVSESTVVRFAMELGYEGFPHFQKELQEELKVKLTSVQRLKASFSLAAREDIVGAVLQADMEKLKITAQELDRRDFQQAVDAILAAERIYLIGVRSAAPLAAFLNFYLSLIFDNIRLIGTSSISEIFEQILPVNDKDIMLAISFPRYSQRTINAMDYAQSKGAKVIAITDKSLSPVAAKADLCLLAPSEMTSFVDSLTAPLSVINALIAAIGFQRQDQVIESLNKLEEVWDQYDVYDKGDSDQAGLFRQLTDQKVSEAEDD